ncbi:Aromatic peroxygenase [Lecanosticta acicola]|uniref:Aromatic peroxygenase n=1 Tax=Lecanosticta acicola TaxID=111012 RepID=A0AAI8Z7A1_9PEZI|nr:Aromatic peroxygenase [Lecanosticta acicola]
MRGESLSNAHLLMLPAVPNVGPPRPWRAEEEYKKTAKICPESARSLHDTLLAPPGYRHDLEGLALYRYQRYQQSVQENPNFYFGPIELLQFGAASFLYTLMPSGTRNYAADEDTISSFFGAEKQSDGTYTFNGMEKIPDNWTNRIHPYDIVGVIQEIRNMYDLHPVLFGGNTADGSFDTINFGAIRDGKLPVDLSVHDVQCLLYQLLTERVPTYLDGLVTPTVETLSLIESKLSRTSFANLGCPQALTK